MQKVIISSKGTSLAHYLRDLKNFKHLLWALSYRNLRAQYAQTFVGFLWVLINPLMSLLILGFVFGKVAKMDTGGIDPFLFTIVGLSAWTYFSSVGAGAGRSIVSSQSMIKKIYFPRILIPMAVALAGLLDLLVVFIILAALLLIHQFVPSSNIIFLPFYLLLIILAGATAGIWISALGVRYRDFHHVVPFLLRVGLYASPVAYAMAAIEESYQIFYLVNPLTGILEGFRWCFFGGSFPMTSTLISVAAIGVLCIFGIVYFHKVEKDMADVV